MNLCFLGTENPWKNPSKNKISRKNIFSQKEAREKGLEVGTFLPES